MSVAAPIAARRATPLILTRVASIALTIGLAVGTCALAFQNGGFFPGTTAVAVLVVGAGLLLWLLASPRPFAARSVPLGLAVGALALFVLWTFISQAWSGSVARAMVEADRALLYSLVAALFGLAAAVPGVRRSLPRAVAAALAFVSTCALITRVLPDLWPTPADVEFDRLSYPTSYWNTQGLIAALALVACLHLATSAREHVAFRALGASGVPLVAAALFFTFSRGAILAVPVGIFALLLLARPQRWASGLLATVPTTAAALIACYRANSLSDAIRPTQAAIDQGHGVAIVLVAAAVFAAAIVVFAARVDVLAWRLRRPSRRTARALIATGAVAVVAAAFAAHLPQRIVDRAGTLGTPQSVPQGDGNRARLTDLADSGRVEQWRVALDAFGDHPLAGSGAGTFAVLWDANRRTDQQITDGHSLYLEVLAELGIVGLVLIVVGVGTLLVGTAHRALRDHADRPLAGVAFSLLLMWALRAGIDWDWEMPVVTVPVLALAAAGVVASARATASPALSRYTRVAVPLVAGLLLLSLMVTPLAIARSQAHLRPALRDVRADRCPQAIDAALASTRALSIRPEPFQVLALCDLRLGRADLGLSAIEGAVRRDPDNWQLRYDLAILRAANGLDPRPELRAAREANPRSQLLAHAWRRFSTNDPEAWRRAAAGASFSIG